MNKFEHVRGGLRLRTEGTAPGRYTGHPTCGQTDRQADTIETITLPFSHFPSKVTCAVSTVSFSLTFQCDIIFQLVSCMHLLVAYCGPQTKLREGHVFTPVCDSVHKGGLCQGCLYPGGSLSRGSLSGGLCPEESLSRGVSMIETPDPIRWKNGQYAPY